MIPGISRIRGVLLTVLALTVGGGCSYSWMSRASDETGNTGPTKLTQAPPVEEPPRPSEPLAIPGPAPVRIASQAARSVVTPKEPAPLTPIPNATPVVEAKPIPPPIPVSDPLRSLHTRAAQRYAAIEAYTAHLKRRERVKGKMQPDEDLFFKFRKQPFSVYFKWVGTEHKGREVIFVKGQHEGKIHTLTASGDGFLGAGKHWALSPDNILVKANSRHSITESGIGVMIDRFGELLDRAAGSLTYLGGVQRPEFGAPVEGVRQHIPPGTEKGLDQGGQRLWFFDPVYNFPLLTITTGPDGQELEYYCYHRFEASAPLSDAEFNPQTLWRR